jgi:glyoxylase-like metal-dependent hydrolase (beta-lactamase superfamily II)
VNDCPIPEAPSWTEPLPGVVRWTVFSPGHKVDLASHAIRTGERWTIFDPIPVRFAIAPPWDVDASPLEIVITNANHERAIGAWRRTARVWAPPGVSAPGAVNLTADNAPPGWRAFPLDGGAPGETALHDASRNMMVFGDAVVNLAGRALELLPERYCTNPAGLRKSLSTLPRFDVALFAHGDPLVGNASDRMRALL